MKVVTASESIIPRGMLRSGSRTSSDTLATLVSPAYDTKTNPMVPISPDTPKGRKGVNWSLAMDPTPSVNTSAIPCTMKKARITISAVTRMRCSPLVSFAPKMLMSMKTRVSPTASGLMGTST